MAPVRYRDISADRFIQINPQELDMFKRNQIAKAVAAAITLALFGAATGSAFAAETKWEKRHPRRVQVNKRLAHQDKRIRHERKEGELSRTQAQALHRQDRQIRQEERSMASMNGGHITRVERNSLNQQENAVSREIGR